MGSRLAALGFPGVRVKTFHAEALAQYRALSGRSDEILPSKTPILMPLTQRLPMPHRFVSVRDIAAEIEWARNRRIVPEAYREAIGDRVPPIPADLMAGV
ncbi:MAG: ATP-dependent helicase UvrD/PcrA, partial [Actinomycetota bacterium]|nr:ATP-dependent helicase UvrD/PcrA [Actinomycetota bacterium]